MGVGMQTCRNFFFFSFLFFFSFHCLHFTRTCIQSSLHMVSLVHVCMFCLLPFLHRWLRFLNDDQREPKATKSYKRVSQTSVHPSSLKHTHKHMHAHTHGTPSSFRTGLAWVIPSTAQGFHLLFYFCSHDLRDVFWSFWLSMSSLGFFCSVTFLWIRSCG